MTTLKHEIMKILDNVYQTTEFAPDEEAANKILELIEEWEERDN